MGNEVSNEKRYYDDTWIQFELTKEKIKHGDMRIAYEVVGKLLCKDNGCCCRKVKFGLCSYHIKQNKKQNSIEKQCDIFDFINLYKE